MKRILPEPFYRTVRRIRRFWRWLRSNDLAPKLAVTYSRQPEILDRNALHVDTRTLEPKPDDFPSWTLIVPAYNVADQIDDWFNALLKIRLLPNELIIADDGSTDDTLERLQNLKKTCPFPIQILKGEHSGPGPARNRAIRQAKHQIILMTDFGSKVHPDWSYEMLLPLVHDPRIEVLCGSSDIQPSSPWDRVVKETLIASPTDIEPMSYLPATRSLGVRKSAWQKAGELPEHLTLWGEDALFIARLRTVCERFAWVPDARVDWNPPQNSRALWRTMYHYGIGYGENALADQHYFRTTLRIILDGIILLLSIFSVILGFIADSLIFIPTLTLLCWRIVKHYKLIQSYIAQKSKPVSFRHYWIAWLSMTGQLLGYWKGKNRRHRLKILTSTDSSILILSPVPFWDSGGGQRATQLAKAFLCEGYSVDFVHYFPSYEKGRLAFKAFHPCLKIIEFNHWDINHWIAENKNRLGSTTLLIEIPHREFLPIAQKLKSLGVRIIYDCIDDWSTTSLGSSWYAKTTEDEFIALADRVCATARSLQQNLKERSGKEVSYIPNASNPIQFYPRGGKLPKELPSNKPLIGYCGALWGDWFRWDLIEAVALAFPEGSFVLIGDIDPDRKPDLPENVCFSGLIAHDLLPIYLQHFDVGLIPFALTPVTRATNPIKTFEYLASGVPVVSTPLPEVIDLPGVLTADQKDEFVTLVKQQIQQPPSPEILLDFAAKESWSKRVKEFLAPLNV